MVTVTVSSLLGEDQKEGVEMGSPGTRYSKEFKAEAVSQVIDRGYSVRDVAERIGVSQHSLYTWVRRERAAQAESNRTGSPSELADEVARLKSELKRTQEERDILRKAAAYFANQSEPGTPS
jgi:transposase